MELGEFIRARIEEDSEVAFAMSELGEQLGVRDAVGAAAFRTKVSEDKVIALTLLELAEYQREDLRSMASLWKGHGEYRAEWAP